ncbi:flagellar export protein FliJ [Candidatus Omnitrophota bacterium]
MKKFKFRLEKVLEHKKRIFDIAQEEYLVELRVLQGEEAKLEQFKDEYKKCMMLVIERTKKQFTIKELAVHYKYLFHLKREIKCQVDVIVAQKKVTDEKRERLIAASKEKEVLVKLKDKRFKTYLQKVDKEEQKVMDDISTAKYIQNQRA